MAHGFDIEDPPPFILHRMERDYEAGAMEQGMRFHNGYAYGTTTIYRTEDGVDYEIEVECEADLRERWATVHGATIDGVKATLTEDMRQEAERQFLDEAYSDAESREYDAREARGR